MTPSEHRPPGGGTVPRSVLIDQRPEPNDATPDLALVARALDA